MVLIPNNFAYDVSPYIVCDFLYAESRQQYNGAFLNSFDFVMKPGSHQVATISGIYAITKPSVKGPVKVPAKLLPNGTKMIVRYGAKPFLEEFPCYVYANRSYSHTDTKYKSELIRVEYTLVGASWAMQEAAKTRSWNTGASYSYLARKIAKSYGFNCIVDTHPKIWDYVVQHGETDFAFLARLAKEIGYTFYVDGTTLLFINPFHILQTPASSTIPGLVMEKLAGNKDSLLEWIPDKEIDTGSNEVRKIFSINKNTNAVIEASNQYLDFTAFDDEDYKRPITSMILASEKVLGSFGDAKEYARFNELINAKWINSKFQGQGDSRIKPGSIINISGMAIIDDSAGYWFAGGEIKHHITIHPGAQRLNEYYVEGILSRDKVYDSNIQVDSTWRAVVSTPVIANGKWRAQRIEEDQQGLEV